jgi:hypothetical protein
MSITSVGIDLGKTTFHLVALDDHGKIVARARSERHLPFHARDRDFREIQPALSLSWPFGICVSRNNFAPRLGATVAPSGRNTKFWQ